LRSAVIDAANGVAGAANGALRLAKTFDVEEAGVESAEPFHIYRD